MSKALKRPKSKDINVGIAYYYRLNTARGPFDLIFFAEQSNNKVFGFMVEDVNRAF